MSTSHPNLRLGYTLPHEAEVLQILRDAGVRRARLFGSAARGELTETSDLDFLVQMPGVAPFDEFMQMVDAQHRIEQLTGRSVDMVTQLRPASTRRLNRTWWSCLYKKLPELMSDFERIIDEIQETT